MDDNTFLTVFNANESKYMVKTNTSTFKVENSAQVSSG
jgi:hypothetical protein